MAFTTILAAIGTAVSVVGALRQGQAQQNQANYQAGLYEQQAAITDQQAQSERTAARQSEEDFRRENALLMGRRRAALGASGVDISTGSPLLTAEDFASEAELGALRIRAGGEATATRLQQQAGLQRSEAGLQRLSGANAVTSSYYRAGSSLLSGAGTIYGMTKKA